MDDYLVGSNPKNVEITKRTIKMYEYRTKVVRVVDGDTVDVDVDLGFGVWLRKERVRLYGIDTPESRTRDKEEKKYGLAAKAFLKKALGTSPILKTTKDGKGKYGRILGEFIVDDGETGTRVNINQLLIEEHHAAAYHGQSKDEIAEQHLINRELVKL
jgi:micrococcal nuclease|tara:strand:+ start:1171 stop:1644 length:474 start_codon:yes stop_codon:yes gene_type:complete